MLVLLGLGIFRGYSIFIFLTIIILIFIILRSGGHILIILLILEYGILMNVFFFRAFGGRLVRNYVPIFVFFCISVCEACVGIGIIINISRLTGSGRLKKVF